MFAWLIRWMKSRRLLPTISDTERAALEAGTVWIEADLFGGKPDFRRFMEEAYPTLTDEERAFLDGPVEEVCAMVQPHEVQAAGDLPPEVWDYLRKHGFFGLLLPREYGGLGFGSLAFSAIVGKLGTRSIVLNSIVLIPNSIGPAELILHYGTPEQKTKFLPALARGEEVPAFALTEPRAGSDAGSIASTGVLFKRPDGTLAIRLDWDKRYITLAPMATLLGLAFRLRDPENLLGKGEDVGITCAVVPTSLPGVEFGTRHDPMGTGFPNGPTRGRGVVLGADHIVGGVEYAGKGWMMLMEALAGGRALSLPSGAAFGVKAAARRVGAYAALREQFGTPIGKFEGVQEPLARIAGRAYLMEAARVYTCGAVGGDRKPAVVSAMVKYQLTELARQVALDSMDVLGGKGICRGPKNPMAEGWMAAPIAITVEGANILTRTLIVFGQGALRCHPYLYREVRALETEDPAELRRALFGHVGHTLANTLRAGWLTLTRGAFASGAPFSRPVSRYVRRLKWASAVYAVLAELILATSGPALKQKGRLTGRFADALTWMFLGVATLRRYEAEGRQKEDLPLVHWSLQTALFEIQTAFQGILANLPGGILLAPIRALGSFWLRLSPIGAPPSDRIQGQVAGVLLVPGLQRERLAPGTWIPKDGNDPVAVLERALVLLHESQPAIRKIQVARKEKKIPKGRIPDLVAPALEAGVLTPEEADRIRQLEAAREEVLSVDEFPPESAAALQPETHGQPVYAAG